MPDFEYPADDATALTSFLKAAGWGLSALLIGCALLLSACTLMVFNVILFHGGLRGIPIELAHYAGIIGTAGVAILGLVSIGFGIRGWQSGAAGFGVAGTVASLVGLVAWLIASGDLLAILGVFK